ncbi:MAG: ATP-dependent Clp protease adaptor ClpS [Leptospiraceae bacterium]|nr:ATP-dependent Clp protease adaptor ClpS [Leptospiraceae bacterium]
MPITEEETEVSTRIDNIYEHKVILFNDDVNPFDHVEDCLMRICFKSEKEARRIAHEAHNKGKAICYDGSIESCETVAEKMGEERLTVSVV